MEGTTSLPRARRWLVVLDLGIVVAVYYLGMLLRLEGMIPQVYRSRFLRFMPVVVGVYLAIELILHISTTPGLARAAGAAALAGLLVALLSLALGARLPITVTIFGALACPIGFVLVRLPLRRGRMRSAS